MNGDRTGTGWQASSALTVTDALILCFFILAKVRQAGSHVIAWHKVHRAEVTDISSTMVGLYSGNGLLLTEDCLGMVSI